MTAGVSAILLTIGGGTLATAVLAGEESAVDQAPGVPRVVRPPAADTGFGVNDDARRRTPDQPAWTVPREPARTSATPSTSPAAIPGTSPTGGASASATGAARADTVGTPAPELPTPVAPPSTSAPQTSAAPTTTEAPAAPPTTVAAPVVTTRTVSETRRIPHKVREVPDPELTAGDRRVQTPGVDGEKTLRYLVTYTDGKQTARRLLGAEVTRPARDEVVGRGESARDDCDRWADDCDLGDEDEDCPDDGWGEPDWGACGTIPR